MPTESVATFSQTHGFRPTACRALLSSSASSRSRVRVLRYARLPRAGEGLLVRAGDIVESRPSRHVAAGTRPTR
eukprot:1493166-Prymnesium_polylepis.3